MESIVKVEHLSHRYTVDWAIQDINFEVNRKGILGLLGSNGAGKSTLMKILTGVYTKDAGQVIVDGKEVCYNNPQESEKAGIVFIHKNHLCILIIRWMNSLLLPRK